MFGSLGNFAGNALGLGYQIYKDNQNEKAKSAARASIDQYNRDTSDILDQAYKNQVQLSDPTMIQQYKDLMSNYDPSNYVYQADQFDKSKYNVEDYLNPNKDRILSDVAKSAQSTAAGAGVGHSSGAVEGINNAIVDKSEQMWNDANTQMTNDRAFDYGMYTNYIAQKQNELNALNSGIQTQMNMLGNAIQYDQTNKDNYLNNQLSLGNATIQAKASLV